VTFTTHIAMVYEAVVMKIASCLISAIYNFDGKVRMGLPLNIGDTVQIVEEYPGKSQHMQIDKLYHSKTAE